MCFPSMSQWYLDSHLDVCALYCSRVDCGAHDGDSWQELCEWAWLIYNRLFCMACSIVYIYSILAINII